MKKKAAKKEKVYPGSAATWILPLLLVLLAITNTAIATAMPILPQTRVRDFFSQTPQNHLGKADLTQHNHWGNRRFSAALAPGRTSFHKDHLGSTSVVTDSMGNYPDGESEYIEYQPYGLPRPGSELSTKTDYAFTDQEFDHSSGFYNFDARLYNPEIGMFITADSLLPDLYDPQQLNRYAYTRNNPIKYIDPDGRDIEIIIGGPYGGHPYGHAALRVYGEGYDYVYDFGRYGETWGIGGSQGEGQMRVWQNSYTNYIKSELRTGRPLISYAFQTTQEQDDAAIAHFKERIGDSKPNLVRKFNDGEGNMKQYRTKKDYDATENNCVTTTVEGAKTARTDISFYDEKLNEGTGLSFAEKAAAQLTGWPEHFFMPADLLNYMETNYKENIKTWGGIEGFGRLHQEQEKEYVHIESN